MSTPDLFHLSAGEAGRLMQARKLSPVELLEAFLGRIDAVDARVKSFLLVTAATARESARKAEKDIVAGRWKGPLHGVPYAVKDNYYTRGVRTCAGSRVLMDFVPEYNATTIDKLNDSGAVLMGKLNTWEYGTGNGGVYFDLPFEPACNPWDLSRFTGGSSTGSGASVAAGTTMVAMGSDTTGSVRLPAASCGLAGMKPTYGLISRHGILPNCYSMDTPGPMTWTVEDNAIMLRAVAGYDQHDRASVDRAVPDYLAGLEAGVRGMTIGILREFGPEGQGIDAANRTQFEEMTAILAKEGAHIVEIELPAEISQYRRVTTVIGHSESASIHEANLLERGREMGFALRDKLMAGSMIRSVDYVAAQRRRRELTIATDAMVRSVDALIAPCAFHVAPPFADNEVLKTLTSQNCCPPFNVSGHPAMTICTGFDANGLPTNAQIVARWFDETTVYRVARAYERVTTWRDRRPIL